MRLETSQRWKLRSGILLILAITLCACGSSSTKMPTATATETLAVSPRIRLPVTRLPLMTDTPRVVPQQEVAEINTDATSQLSKNAADYVVRLRVQNCMNSDNEYTSLTGFFVAEYTGIVTALHGVVACQHADPSGSDLCIRANVAKTWQVNQRSTSQSRSYDCLKIIDVDTLHDVVHIDSDQLAQDRTHFWPQDGLDIVEANSVPRPLGDWRCGINYHENIFVYGFPGLSKSGIPKIAPILCVRALLELLTDESQISDNLLGNLIRRNSPNLEQNVFHIGNNVLSPGDSGAPVMRQNDNKVYGVVLGGIPGLSYVAWAVPWTQLNWKKIADIDTQVEVERLSSLRLDTTSVIDEFDIFWGFAPNFGEDAVPPAGINTPYLSIDNSRPWQGDLPAVVYTPEDSCVVILTDNYYSSSKETIARIAVTANEFDTNLSIGMARLPNTLVSTYKNFCNQLANQESVTLYAYLYERQNNNCTQPWPTENGIVYDKFELYASTDVWSTGFCADDDIRLP